MKYVFVPVSAIIQQDTVHYKALEKTGFWGKQGSGCLVKAQSTGRVLLALRSDLVQEPNTWGMFGGAIDSKENPKRAMMRELREEIGNDFDTVNVLPLMVYRKDTFKYYNFLVVVETEFEPELNWETDDTRWFTIGKWPKPLHFGVSALFKHKRSYDTIVSA